jgi:NAD(P)-dependent dehydrogenase (short-subunit alcohol dehydrogenase family)
MTKLGKLSKKRALVTGAGTGIGREIALEFAREGADVVLHYSHESEGAETAAGEIELLGCRVAIFKEDFNDLNAAHRLADSAIAFLGGIDCLVNNAGITFNRPFVKMKPEQLDTLLNVNFKTPYFLTQRIAEQMLKQGGGSICYLSSIHGLQGAPEHTAYASTKGAITACMRSLAVELGYQGVRVNAIAPGWIMVDSHAVAIADFSLERSTEDARDKVPLAKYGIPSDVAKMAAYLCSEDAGFITGQTFVVDGGTTTLMSLMSDFRTESTARFGIGFIPGT